MKISKRILCTALSALMAMSAMVVGTTSASAALKAPKSISAANDVNYIKLQWSKVSGATKYQLFRNNQKISTVSGTSYYDCNVTSGSNYIYKVKAVSGNTVSAAKTSKKITRLFQSIIETVSNKEEGIKVTWRNRKGANSAIVYRKTASSSFKKLATTSKLSYIDKNVVPGVKYTYKVVRVNTTTNSISTATTRAIIRLLASETVTARQNVTMDGITVAWSAVQGAKSYDVYRMNVTEGNYTKIASTTSTTYNDKSAAVKNPTYYYYRIVSVNGKSTSVASDVRIASWVLKEADKNRYYYDEDNALHVQVYLKKGEVYDEGKGLIDTYSLEGLIKEEELNNDSNVFQLKNHVITAKNTGSASVKVTLTDEAKQIISVVNSQELAKLLTSTYYCDVFVE